MSNIAVLVSGGGTNLQALIDAQGNVLQHGKIKLVISSKPDVYALQRAEKAGIDHCVIAKRDYITQEEFSKKSGVSFGSIKRFENTGEISLFSLIKIAIVLECEDEFLNLFQQKQYNSIEEIINEQD